MTHAEKLRIAHGLAEFGVDVIQAGFPAPSRGDWDAVDVIACEVHGAIRCGRMGMFPAQMLYSCAYALVILFLHSGLACWEGASLPCPLIHVRNQPESWAKRVAHVDTLLDDPRFVAIGALRSTDPAVMALSPASAVNLKATVLTQGSILASMAGKAECLKFAATDVTRNWIPVDHIAALLEAHILPLYIGAMHLHVERAAILEQPLRFLRLVDRYPVSVPSRRTCYWGRSRPRTKRRDRVPRGGGFSNAHPSRGTRDDWLINELKR